MTYPHAERPAEHSLPIPDGGRWVTLKEHFEALAAEREQRYQEVAKERDQRYAEVKAEQEKALVIKDTASRDALALARHYQTYRDEQANKLREQINSERGLYATKDDLANAMREISATIKPLADYISAAGGRSGGEAAQKQSAGIAYRNVMQGIMALIAALSVIAIIVMHH